MKNALIYGVLCFVAVLIWDIITDYKKYLDGRKVRHGYEAVLRVVLLLPSIFFFYKASVLVWILTLPVVCFMEFFVWWLLFDSIYNKLIGQELFFAGTTSDIDKVINKWPVAVRAAVKIGGSALFVFLYVKFFL